MRTIDVLDAGSDLQSVADAVLQTGETITLTRGGRPVADVIPRRDATPKAKTNAEVFAKMDALRKTLRPITMEEIQSAKEEGRR